MKLFDVKNLLTIASLGLSACGAEPPAPPAAGIDGDDINGTNPDGEDPDNPQGPGNPDPKDILPLKLAHAPLAAADVYCPQGGTHVIWYVDADKDDAQSSGDIIRQSAFLCYGKGTNQIGEDVPNPDLAVTAKEKPASAKECAFAGAEKTILIDKDKDGATGKGDVVSNVTLCNNSGSTFSLSGFDVLTAQRALGKGHSQCAEGGVEHSLYVDRDKSGTFSNADFLVSATFICTFDTEASHEDFGQVLTALKTGDSACTGEGVLAAAYVDTDGTPGFSNGDEKFTEALCAGNEQKPIAFNVSAIAKNRNRTLINLVASDPLGKAIIDYKISTPISAAEGTVQGTYPSLYFQPAAGFDGKVTFRYRVINAAYVASEEATVTVHVRKPRIGIVTTRCNCLINGVFNEYFPADEDTRKLIRDMGFNTATSDMLFSFVARSTVEKYDVVVISKYAVQQDAELKDAKVPIVTMSSVQNYRLELTQNLKSDLDTDFDITRPEHPLAAFLSGTQSPYFNAEALYYPSDLHPSAQVIATLQGNPGAPVLYMFERGAMVYNGLILPERRIGFAEPYNDPNPASGRLPMLFGLTRDGISMLESAIYQALAGSSP